MAISIKARDVPNFNSIGTLNGPKKDQYLDFVDDTGGTVASLLVPASGDTPTFSVDGAPVGGVQTVYSATVTLNNTEIKAWPDNPVTMVAGQGAGTVIVPQTMVVAIRSTVAYADLDVAASLKLYVGALQFCTLETAEEKANLSNILTSGDDEIWFIGSLPGVNAQGLISGVEDGDCVLYLDQADVLTAGGAADELSITLKYTIDPV